MVSNGSDAATPIHRHSAHSHHVVHKSVDPAMTAIVPRASALRHDNTDGLSRSRRDIIHGESPSSDEWLGIAPRRVRGRRIFGRPSADRLDREVDIPGRCIGTRTGRFRPAAKSQLDPDGRCPFGPPSRPTAVRIQRTVWGRMTQAILYKLRQLTVRLLENQGT